MVLKYVQLYLCVCVLAHMFMCAGAHWKMCACIGRPENSLECHSLDTVHFLFLKTISCHPRTHQLGCAGWSVNPRVLPLSASPVLGLQTWTLMFSLWLILHECLRSNSGPHLAEETLCWLSYPLGPRCVFRSLTTMWLWSMTEIVMVYLH